MRTPEPRGGRHFLAGPINRVHALNNCPPIYAVDYSREQQEAKKVGETLSVENVEERRNLEMRENLEKIVLLAENTEIFNFNHLHTRLSVLRGRCIEIELKQSETLSFFIICRSL